MSIPRIAPLPPFLALADGMIIRITAIDAVTGATVSGVKVSNVAIDVDMGGPDGLPAEPPLPPLLFQPAGSEV